ncbi:MAG: LON peptidase substrate-binding domain-containing protein [Chloroflexi bacterium]|nr:LON peptidase substrate-binding domain-containing protein [Chloroflexota bacterium]
MTEQSSPNFLRLFPLQSVVLFPGMELPLVVFEPRYVQLTNECTEAGEPFGVLLLRAGREVGDDDANPHDIGTTAHIRSVNPLGQGRFSVAAVGGRRFRVLSLSHDQPYLSADVEYLEDEGAEDVDLPLVADVKASAVTFIRAMLAMRGGYVREVPLPDDAVTLSYQVAQLFQGDSDVQQKLLELRTSERLSEELELIKKATEQVKRRGEERQRRRFSPN